MMAKAPLHRMLLAVVVVLSRAFCNVDALLLDAPADRHGWGPFVEESQPTRGSSSRRKQVHVTRGVPTKDAWVPCTVVVCPPNSNITAVTPPSNVHPTHMKARHTYTKTQTRAIGKYETRYTNLSHEENRSACQFCFPVSVPMRFSLTQFHPKPS